MEFGETIAEAIKRECLEETGYHIKLANHNKFYTKESKHMNGEKKRKTKEKKDKQTEHLLLHCKPIPVMRTGFSLCSISIRETPVFITGIPANDLQH